MNAQLINTPEVGRIAEDLDAHGAERWLNAYAHKECIEYTIGVKSLSGQCWEIVSVSGVGQEIGG